jgi:hypothetical protein
MVCGACWPTCTALLCEAQPALLSATHVCVQRFPVDAPKHKTTVLFSDIYFPGHHQDPAQSPQMSRTHEVIPFCCLLSYECWWSS